jgi:hypothetical protein
MNTLYNKYLELYNACESHNECLFITKLYDQIKTQQQAKFFMTIKAQVIVFVNRDYRLDFTGVFKDKKYAMEIEGGVFSKGLASVGYRSIMGYIKHADKYNLLSAHNWFVFRFQLHKPQLSDLWGVLGI